MTAYPSETGGPAVSAADNRPLVSVGIPTYNRPAGLRKCLEHLVQQTWPHLDIIISNNCSTHPEVAAIINEYAQQDQRIRAFHQPENLGLEGNFNFVIAQARADYFMWMSDDDYFDANYIEACINFLEKNKDYVLCSGCAKYYAGGQYRFTEKMYPLTQSSAFFRLVKYFFTVLKNGMFYGVFRRSAMPPQPIRAHIGCDWTFMAQLALSGKLGYTAATNYHRSDEGNSGTKKKMIARFKLKGLQAIFFELYIARTVATHIFTQAMFREKFSWLARLCIVVMVYCQVAYLHILHFFRNRVLSLFRKKL
jgi:glycosyltransferase domain-containing protein